MKYLYETYDYKYTEDVKEYIKDILSDLGDDGYESIIYHNHKEDVYGIFILSKRRFSYEDIKSDIHSISSYMKQEGFEITLFTQQCTKNINPVSMFLTPSNNYNGFDWGNPPTILRYPYNFGLVLGQKRVDFQGCYFFGLAYGRKSSQIC